METLSVSLDWPGPDLDILRVHVEPWRNWDAEPIAGMGTIAILWEIDAAEVRTGRVAGIEIVDFLSFDDWAALPDLPVLWELPDEPPATLVDLLRRAQTRLRRQVAMTTR